MIIQITQKKSLIMAQDELLKVHECLLDFLSGFNSAKRNGIHDYIELTIFNMITEAFTNIDEYLNTGHKQVAAKEIMHIVVESYKKVLDRIKRNLDGMDEVDFE